MGPSFIIDNSNIKEQFSQPTSKSKQGGKADKTKKYSRPAISFGGSNSPELFALSYQGLFPGLSTMVEERLCLK